MVSPYDSRPGRPSVLATARRTVDLINVLTPADQQPDAVAAVLRAHGEAEPIELSEDEVGLMRDAALSLREVFAAEQVDTAAERLNQLLRAGTGPVRLTSHGGATPWHPHLDSDDEAAWAEWFLATSCMTLLVLVWDHQTPPGGLCAASGCGNVYLAFGRGPARRYCSRQCATRERVATHRRGRSAAAGTAARAPAPPTREWNSSNGPDAAAPTSISSACGSCTGPDPRSQPVGPESDFVCLDADLHPGAVDVGRGC